ncbi:hypothetical protein H8I91_09395 [Serratia fonticola]|uniref:hypothetical protein n=1 Tax=Serratia fonticola TaxID=47917 RepID=UPI0016483A5A|nr:hypothetical protein [Serratia fonticola]MBC3250476.1 hypothetical protein [Serratia fonticola]
MDKQTESLAREKFEEKLVEWWPEAKGNLVRDDDDYVNHFISYAWAGWRMSRESLVVELPDELRIESIIDKKVQQAFVNGHLLGRKECADALRAIGIRIKGEGV